MAAACGRRCLFASHQRKTPLIQVPLRQVSSGVETNAGLLARARTELNHEPADLQSAALPLSYTPTTPRVALYATSQYSAVLHLLLLPPPSSLTIARP